MNTYRIVELLGDGISAELSESVHRIESGGPVRHRLERCDGCTEPGKAMDDVLFRFDQIPGEPSLKFAGSFSVYPFFDSGTIVMSSMGEGLFILRPEVVPTR